MPMAKSSSVPGNSARNCFGREGRAAAAGSEMVWEAKKDRYREQSAASGESAVYQPMWWMMLRRTSAAKTRAMAMAAASTLKASLLCGSDCLLFEMLRGI
jgi:hypothetical protein